MAIFLGTVSNGEFTGDRWPTEAPTHPSVRKARSEAYWDTTSSPNPMPDTLFHPFNVRGRAPRARPEGVMQKCDKVEHDGIPPSRAVSARSPFDDGCPSKPVRLGQ
jgi:hypothetical protein